MEFLELVDNIKAEEADTRRLFNSTDGKGVRGMRRNDPRYMASLAEAATFVADVHDGRRPMAALQEAMTTSDFPILFGDVLDRQLLGSYLEWDPIWSQIARRATVRDFRTVKRFAVDGGEGALSQVEEQQEYTAAALADSKFEYSVKKYGRRLPFSWEAFVNDDLDGLRSAPERLGKAARMTEEKFATDLYAGTTGPDGTFFAAGNTNIVTSNPVLSVAALQTAFTVLRAQKDADGNPIFHGRVKLVVPPALQVTAQNILAATQIRVAAGSSSSSTDQLVAANWMADLVDLVVNPWLPIISTTNGNTSWYLFGEPTLGRPAMEVGFLRGHETPEVFLKSPNAQRIGGGVVGAEDGDFETDSVEYKVRHVVGGTLLDPKAAVASNGTGS
jgi:hypothetical protein